MNQMLKKASSVFTAIVCAASITFSGASLVLADGEIDEQTKTTIETTAEGLTNTIIPLTEDEIAAYMESGDAFTENAMTAWDSAREELGDLKKAGSAEIEYSNDEYTATVPVEFEKEDAEFIYVFDKNLTPTSLSVDVKYSFATTMKNAALNTVLGLGTVFVILIMLIFLISLFQFIPGSGAQEAKAKKKAAEEAFHIAEEANQSKSRFLSNMSHDMRTPMNAIVGFTTLLDNESKNPEKVQEYTKKIAFSSQHLLGLINDVLDMSKIEAGKMKLTLEEENMDEIIENIDALVRPQMVLRRQKFEIIVELLKMEGAECTVCENGQLAVETFTASEENTINLILMDVQMPVMNGYEAMKAIRSSGHPMAETIPIIAMTANAFVEDIHDALDAGMDAHVAKPVDMKVLKETVAQVIGGRS